MVSDDLTRLERDENRRWLMFWHARCLLGFQADLCFRLAVRKIAVSRIGTSLRTTLSLSLTCLIKGNLGMRTLVALWQDEAGFVISAELVLVLTIGVLAMVVGINAVAKSVVMELNDVSNAIGALDQSFAYRGLRKPGHAAVHGSAFIDSSDECDCSVVYTTTPRAKRDGSGMMHENGSGGGGGID